MQRIGYSVERVFLVARNTLTEAIRQRLFTIVWTLAVVVIVSSQLFREFNFGSSELKFISDFGFGAITFFGAILSVAVTAQLFFSEIDNRTALTLLAKPVHRWEFLLGKFAGIVLVLGLFVLTMVVCLAAVLSWREHQLILSNPDMALGGRVWIHFDDIFLFGFVQWCKLGLLSAITLLIATFSTTNLFAMVMGFMIYMICQLQYLALDAWHHSDTWVAVFGLWVVGKVFPNFQLFNFGDQVASGHALPITLVFRVLIYGFFYWGVALGLAVYSFRKREI